MTEPQASPIAALLDRLSLLAMLAVLAAILSAAMFMQYAFGEIPCPLCLLQRFAMFGCCFGLIWQLSSDRSERGTGIAMIFAVLLLVISIRQTLLDICPRPGHDYVGTAVLGLHLPVWSVVIAAALLLGFALRLTLFDGVRTLPPAARPGLDAATRLLRVYVVAILVINLASVLLQCGFGECHTFSYRFL